MTAAIVFTIGGIFQIIGLDLTMMYAGRVISGLGVGALSMLVPVSNTCKIFSYSNGYKLII
jgi:hypothetical protein